MAISHEQELIYTEIKQITEIIGQMSLPKDLANLKSPIQQAVAAAISRKAEVENPELFKKIIPDFIGKYRTNGMPKIFGSGDDFYKYDPEKIKPLNLLAMLLMMWGRVTDENLFCRFHDLPDALEDLGYAHMAKYLSNHYLLQCAMSENIYRMFS